MRVLFLDQNKWIDLARGMKDPSHAAAPVFQQLRQEVEAGRVICPLTITQILETAKRNDLRTRTDVATAQAVLSRGHVYRSRKARLLVEMRIALHKIFDEDPVALPQHWAIVPGFTLIYGRVAKKLGSKHAVSCAKRDDFPEDVEKAQHRVD